MQAFKCKELYCSAAEMSLANLILILYPDSFMLCKKAISNALCSKVCTSFISNKEHNQSPCLFLTLKYQLLVDKQTYFENIITKKNY